MDREAASMFWSDIGRHKGHFLSDNLRSKMVERRHAVEDKASLMHETIMLINSLLGCLLQ